MAHEASVTVGATATVIASAAVIPAGGTIIIQNQASVTMWVGTDSSVTVGVGTALAAAVGTYPAVTTPGGSMAASYGEERSPDTWYGAATGGGATATYLTVGN